MLPHLPRTLGEMIAKLDTDRMIRDADAAVDGDTELHAWFRTTIAAVDRAAGESPEFLRGVMHWMYWVSSMLNVAENVAADSDEVVKMIEGGLSDLTIVISGTNLFRAAVAANERETNGR